MASSSSVEIYLIIASSIIGMLLLAGFLILFVILYQKRMLREQLHRQDLERTLQQKILQATLESQEAERRKVAGDLHDSIGGMLSAIRVGLAGLARQLPEPQKMDPSKQMLDETIESVRRISRDLMPSTLEKFGLQPAVRELAERLQATSRIQISVVEIGQNKPMEKQRELMIFRIAQELLNNAIKHAKATYIELLFQYEEMMILSVEDNGIGISQEQFAASGIRSLGLYNVQSRVQLLNATLDIDQKTEGCKFIVRVPYNEP
jgi:two-component system, NarL family, sensor kinase